MHPSVVWWNHRHCRLKVMMKHRISCFREPSCFWSYFWLAPGQGNPVQLFRNRICMFLSSLFQLADTEHLLLGIGKLLWLNKPRGTYFMGQQLCNYEVLIYVIIIIRIQQNYVYLVISLINILGIKAGCVSVDSCCAAKMRTQQTRVIVKVRQRHYGTLLVTVFLYITVHAAVALHIDVLLLYHGCSTPSGCCSFSCCTFFDCEPWA